MRQKITTPVGVPPIKPVGLLSDNLSFTDFRPFQAGVPIRLGARVRVANVLGTVLRHIAIPDSLDQEMVIRLDHTYRCEAGEGNFLVARLQSAGTRWVHGVNVIVELCDFEPNTRFLRLRDKGVVIKDSTVCELL